MGRMAFWDYPREKRHGIGGYRRGCRCPSCKAAKSAANARYYRSLVTCEACGEPNLRKGASARVCGFCHQGV